MAMRKFTENLETGLLPLIQFKGADQNHEMPARVLLWVLKRFSRLYEAVVRLRLWLYDRSILARYPLGCQVISVGNITAGGTGKTPMVEALARNLRDRGRTVAILSRGYRKKEDKFSRKPSGQSLKGTVRVVSDGHRLHSDSEHSGDEPYMLACNLPGVAVLVDKNRVRSGRYAVRTFGCDTLLLDDGFQYQRLKHSHDLVLVDCGNPFGNENVLPRGILREPLGNLARAQFICITKIRGHDTSELKARIRELNPRIRNNDPESGLMECDHVPRLLREAFPAREPTYPCPIEDARPRGELPLSALAGKRVYALAGIASPRSFEASLEDLRATIVGRRHFADHHRYSRKEVAAIVRDAARLGADMVVTTEKDAVRMPRPDSCPVPVYCLRIEIQFKNGLDKFENCIGLITNPSLKEKTP